MIIGRGHGSVISGCGAAEAVVTISLLGRVFKQIIRNGLSGRTLISKLDGHFQRMRETCLGLCAWNGTQVLVLLIPWVAVRSRHSDPGRFSPVYVEFIGADLKLAQLVIGAFLTTSKILTNLFGSKPT